MQARVNLRISTMINKIPFAVLGTAVFLAPYAVQAQTPLLKPALQVNTAGTFSATSNGIELKADFKFQAPHSLRIDLQPNGPALVNAQTVIASGDQTLLYDLQTRRIQRLGYNIVKQPWRSGVLGWAGAANIALFGLDTARLSPYYTAKTATEGLTLTAKPAAGRLVRDFVRSGSDRQALFYAVYKRRIWDFPQQLQLTLHKGKLVSQTEYGQDGGTVGVVAVEYNAANLPTKVTTRDGQNRVTNETRFDLKNQEGDFAADTFSLSAVEKEQVIEEDQLQPLSEYRGKTGANSRFNQGIALAKHTEDFAAAFSLWNGVANALPQATAPHFATYQAAVTSRNLGLAQTALGRLSELLGADSLQVLSRRANLAMLRRDSVASSEYLEAAQKVAPQDLGITLLRANLLRGQGKPAEAKNLLLQILASDLPQQSTQGAAAEALASYAWGATDFQEILAGLPSDTQWQKLARLHLALWQGEKPEIIGLTDPLAKASIAVALEREGHDDVAVKLWGEINSASQAASIVAQQHLEMLAARRGDTGQSLKNFRSLLVNADDEATRQRETDILRETWRKNYRQPELRAALESRAISAGVAEMDLKAWLTYLEAAGTTDEIGAAVRSALGRFDNGAFWHSRLAEQLLVERGALPYEQERARANLFKEAQQEAQRAIELAPDQPYYAMQLALVALQRNAEKSSVINASEEVAKKEATADALNKLEQTWPNDPDAMLLVALGRKDLAHGSAESLEAIRQALQSGTPGRETITGEQHTTAFFTRQALALGYRKLKRWDEAAREYQALLLSSQTATEELGLGINYIAMQGEKAGKGNMPDLESITPFLERAVSQPWSYGDSQMMLQNYMPLILPNRQLSAQLASLLVKGNAARRVAGAQLLYEIEKLAIQDADAPNAPPATERFLRQTQTLAASATESLKEIGSGADKLVASRALALLAERSLAKSNPGEAAGYLTSAIAIEPRELALRTGLIRALSLSGQRAEALAARDDLLRVVPRDGETLRQAALASLQLDQDKDALRLANQAQNAMQTSRDASPAQLQSTAFVLARALFANDKKDDAVKVYKQLSGPQWSTADQAAALIDMEAQLRATGQDPEADAARNQLDALKVSKRDLQLARSYLERFD